ncbi:hypothetical protein [Roseisolibacter agri]|uniref:Uncharacterized protein n=1 Tax=Roseisolibacter agri TaxID=2014610 RepID=A0AA37Q402_9BACT|nr:hypothetical protein [Roseisolibacter agri]GLC25959.1 hypothetical protein rosag_24720 [Roseisolibacter agri]
MATRQNFSEPQRQSAFEANAHWLRDHRVTGVELALAFEPLRQRGQVYYCENCLFCHSDQVYFDIDHLVPDRSFRLWQKHVDAREPINMVVLCKSLERGDLGCNQSKGARLFVPPERGLALSRTDLDMNCFPVRQRPREWEVARGA